MAPGAPARAGRERRQRRHAEVPAARSGAAGIRPQAGRRAAQLTLARTEPAHIAGARRQRDAVSQTDAAGGYEVRPTGNAVNLEDEMMKVAANQMDYQAATALYTPQPRPDQDRASASAERDERERHGLPQIDRDRGVRPARAGRPHARHLREHRQRRFDRAARRRRSLPAQDPDLHAASSTARSTRSVVGARPRAAPIRPTSASSTSPAIRPPTPTATSNIRTSIRWSK